MKIMTDMGDRMNYHMETLRKNPQIFEREKKKRLYGSLNLYWQSK